MSFEPASSALWPKISPLRPPRWATDGHRQTLLGYLLSSAAWTTPWERVEIEVSDGDRLVGQLHPGSTDLLVYLFHGLGGCAQSPYMQRMARLIEQQHHGVFLVNHRGSGPGVGLARKPYHSGVAEDLAAALKLGRQRFPHCRHLAIGFSLSGNALLLLLSDPQRGTQPDYAIAVNAPIHLDNTSVRLSQGLNRIYDIHFVRLMRQRMKEKIQHGHLHPYQYRLSGLNTLREFDEIYLAREAGFRNRQDYYESCSTYDKLAQVTVPTVMLTAEDDPFIDAGDYVRSQLSPAIHLHIERHGGHMGYLSQDLHPKYGRRWMDYALSEYIRSFFNLKSSARRQPSVPHSKGTSTFPTF